MLAAALAAPASAGGKGLGKGWGRGPHGACPAPSGSPGGT
eukprot:gene14152-11667_t